MRNPLVATLVLVAGGLVALTSPSTADSGLAPYQLVRSLQLVQDRIAGGDHAALPMQRKLLTMIDARFRSAPPEAFADPRDATSILVYAMSGGNPNTVELVLSRLDGTSPILAPAPAVLDYLKGRPGAALRALSAVDTRKVDAEVAPFLALVKGGLIALENPERALGEFDFARLAGPGTLVEEAALRRSIQIAASLGDMERFLRHAEQYVRRFLDSPYAAQFAESFVSGVVARAGDMSFEDIDTVVSQMSPEQQKVIYLRIARAAAIDGLEPLSSQASSRATTVSAPGPSKGEARARLYSAMATVTSESVDTVLADLEAIDPTMLSTGDRRLLDAAKAIARGVLRPPDAISGTGLQDDLSGAASEIAPSPMVEATDEPDLVPATTAPADAPSSSPVAVPVAAEPASVAPAAQVPSAEPLGGASEQAADAAAAAARPDEVDMKIEATRKAIAEIDDLVAPKKP